MLGCKKALCFDSELMSSSPETERFSISTGTFQVNSLRWHQDGDSILLLSKDKMCLCFLTPNEA